MQKLHFVFVALLAVAIIAPSLAFAETNEDTVLQKAAADAISGVVIQGDAGAGMGFVLSFVRVMGKNLNASLS